MRPGSTTFSFQVRTRQEKSIRQLAAAILIIVGCALIATLCNPQAGFARQAGKTRTRVTTGPAKPC